MDYGHKESDKMLKDLEKRLAREYAQAEREVAQKLAEYLKAFERKDAKKLMQLNAGEISQKEYLRWRKGQVLMGQRWQEMQETLAEDLHNVNNIASNMITTHTQDVYALNHNYGTFEVEKGSMVDTSYTLYNREAVARLMRDDPSILPKPGKYVSQRIAEGKDVLWNKQQVQSVMMQSLLQGESIPKIAKRLVGEVGESYTADIIKDQHLKTAKQIAKELAKKNRAAAIRNARTMTTGAENAGRVDAYKRGQEMGVKSKQMWVATLDNRTRHEHRLLDSQIREIGEPFEIDGEKLRFPGDPTAPGYLVYNCRCGIIAVVKGSKLDKEGLDTLPRNSKLGDMTYDEWKGEHKSKPAQKTNVNDYGITFDYQTQDKRLHIVQMQYIPTQETLDKYDTIGIRAVPTEQEGKYKIGDILPESYDWDHEKDISTYYTTGETLGGSSCLFVKIKDGEPLDISIQKALQGTYEYEGKDIFIVGGKFVNEGEDINEVIIGNATTIGKIGIYNADEKIPKLSELKIETSDPKKTTLKEIKQNIESINAEDIKEKTHTVGEKSKKELFEEFKAEMILKYPHANPFSLFGELSAEEKKKWRSLQ